MVNQGGAFAAAAVVITVGVSIVAAFMARPAAIGADSAAAPTAMVELTRASADLGPIDPHQRVPFLLTLRNDRAAAELEAIRRLYDRGSPSFGRYATGSDLDGPGPAAADVEWIRRELSRAGLTSDWRAGQDWLSGAGSARDTESVFGVAMHRYRSRSGIEFVAPTRAPSIPGRWAAIVTAIDDLSDYPRSRTAAVPPGGLAPVDLLRAYNITPLRELGLDGAGQTVVVTVPNDGYRQESLDTFTSRFALPPIILEPVKVDDPLEIEVAGELEMDLETIHSIAPAARLVVYSWKDTRDVQVLTTVQARAVSENPGAIISQSWGGCEAGWSAATLDAFSEIHREGAKSGVTVFVSSGDSGAYTCLSHEGTPGPLAIGAAAPSTIPLVTSVGGTRISVRADGTYYRESVWSWPAATEATGGGPSMHFPRPDWQVAPGVPPAGPGSWRLTPDVAAVAAPESGNAIYITGSGWSTGGGTSLSAPIWAGITALINQYLTQRGLPVVGAMNEALYTMAREKQPFPPFHDVVQGGNLVESAGPGWDASTGLGTPDAYNLARNLEQYMKSGSR